ncbi:TetR family transcriptional regulator [Glaciihabitans sp. dw_435]|uniref:TetR family transcriptional regulator n=1 Tax=Glaciihabitans sp. dw_435 TaxID=2720081 RepID=UPI001BD516B5|nr:TetR family transcriptional regulator [Glaciihabitans sp. dw_435]
MNVAEQPTPAGGHLSSVEAAVLSLRERRRRDTEIEVSSAALDLFEKNGVAATTIADIARAAGISDRTFFRYYSSKEETVLDFQQWFRTPTREWLTTGITDGPVLEQLEAVCVGVLRQLDGPNRDAANRLRRIRALMKTEPSLRAVSAMLDDERAYSLADQIVESFHGRVSLTEARLTAEIVGVGLRTACQMWSARLDNGDDATLEGTYQAVRSTIHSLTAPSAL